MNDFFTKMSNVDSELASKLSDAIAVRKEAGIALQNAQTKGPKELEAAAKAYEKAISDTTTDKLITSFAYFKNRALFNVSTGIIGTSLRRTATGAALYTLTLTSKDFIKEILLRPERLKLATELGKLPPSNSRAKYLQKTLFGAMKGVQVLITSPDGEEEVTTLK